MSEFKGTKGVWVIKHSHPNPTIIDINAGDQLSDDWGIFTLYNAKDSDTQLANAKLISCSPELLNNAQMHIDYFDLSDFVFYEKYAFNKTELIPMTRKLIKKATE